jgi:hypothetical protein
MMKRIFSIPPVKEPDWYTLARTKYIPQFSMNLPKFYLASVVKKLYELYAYYEFPAKIADKLTKDVNKSFLRKLQKMNRWSASKRIFYTSLYGIFFTYSSTLTIDVAIALGNYFIKLFSGKRSLREIPNDVLQGTVWLSKKVVLSSISCAGFATGVSIGGYLSGTTTGITFGSLIFEVIFSGIGGAVILL